MLIISEIFSLLATIVLPIGFAVYFCVNLDKGWKWILYGVLCMLIFSIAIPYPLMHLFASWGWMQSIYDTSWWLYDLLVSVIVVGVAELGRWLIEFFFMGKNCDDQEALAFGCGIGMSESVLMSGFTLLILVFSGAAADSTDFWISGIERICMLIMNMGWSMMVMQQIRKESRSAVLIVLVSHFLIQYVVTAFNSILQIPLWAGEILLCLAAALMAFYIWKTLKKQPE